MNECTAAISRVLEEMKMCLMNETRMNEIYINEWVEIAVKQNFKHFSSALSFSNTSAEISFPTRDAHVCNLFILQHIRITDREGAILVRIA